MSKCIALLRGINVGGRNTIPMAGLREMAEQLGLKRPGTLLQSGNLVFEAGRKSPQALERLLEEATVGRFDLAIDYVVRSAAEWDRILAANPFHPQAEEDPSHLVVMCLKSPPVPAGVKALQAAIAGPEIVRADGRQLYLYYPAGIGNSKLTNTLIEKKLEVRGTARNWNTVLKIAESLASPA